MNGKILSAIPNYTVSRFNPEVAGRPMKVVSRWSFNPQYCLVAVGLMMGVVLTGCRTPRQEERFARPFDAARVAQLSHEAYRVAWDATFWAKRDLRFAAFQPTRLDYEAVSYLNSLTWRVPWLARNIEKYPATARRSSQRTYDYVAYEAMMLRRRYQPTSFQASTCAKIERVLRLVDEIAPYYASGEQPDAPKGQPEKAAGS